MAGRIDDSYHSYTLGILVTPGPRTSLYADYTWEDRDYGLETRFRTSVSGIGSDNPLDNWGTVRGRSWQRSGFRDVHLPGA